jgi:hypothetical protein
MEQYSIEIDCKPGNPRPGDLLPGVLEGTGLTEKDFVLAGTFFGNWTWVVKHQKRRDYEKHRDAIKRRLTILHDSGVVRYASW